MDKFNVATLMLPASDFALLGPFFIGIVKTAFLTLV